METAIMHYVSKNKPNGTNKVVRTYLWEQIIFKCSDFCRIIQSSEIISAVMKFIAIALLLFRLQQAVSQNDRLDFPGMTKLGEYRENVLWPQESNKVIHF